MTQSLNDPHPKVTAGQIAASLNAPLVGDPSRLLNRIDTLANADAATLSWFGNVKYLPQLETTKAGAVLLPAEAPLPPHVTGILVADPDLALNTILRLFAPREETVPPGVHSTAVIAPNAIVEGAAIGPHVSVGEYARIGPGTQLHPGVRIGSHCQLGRDCVIWPNAVVRERCRLGDRVILHPNVTIGSDGFGYLPRGGKHIKVPQIGIVVIDDDVEIGASTCVDRAKSGVTRIRRGTKIDNLVQIGHNNDIGEDCIVVGQAGIAGSCRVGNGVILGGQCGLIDHLTIGDGAIILPQTGLERDVPPGAVLRGMPPATENRRAIRQQLSTAKLPELMEQVRILVRRIERLESSANDRTRS